MIEVSGLRKSFAEVTALKGVSFSAQNAKVTGLLGPNGAGKSTSLRILYGLLKPDTGWAKIDGLDVSLERLKAQARLGVLPDGHGLHELEGQGRRASLTTRSVVPEVHAVVLVLEAQSDVVSMGADEGDAPSALPVGGVPEGFADGVGDGVH